MERMILVGSRGGGVSSHAATQLGDRQAQSPWVVRFPALQALQGSIHGDSNEIAGLRKCHWNYLHHQIHINQKYHGKATQATRSTLFFNSSLNNAKPFSFLGLGLTRVLIPHSSYLSSAGPW